MKLTIKNNLLQNSVRARLKLILQEICSSFFTHARALCPAFLKTYSHTSISARSTSNSSSLFVN